MSQQAAPQTGSNGNADGGQGGTRDEATAALRDELTRGARDLSTDVKHVATELAGDAKKAAESKLGAGKDLAADQLGVVASALRHTSDKLRSEESAMTEYVEKAATSVTQASRYLETHTLAQLIGDVQSFARREPAVFLGGAFFAGLLGGRFLKSATPAAPSITTGPGAAKAQGGGMSGRPQGQGGAAVRFERSSGQSTSARSPETSGSQGATGDRPAARTTPVSASGSTSAARSASDRASSHPSQDGQSGQPGGKSPSATASGSASASNGDTSGSPADGKKEPNKAPGARG